MLIQVHQIDADGYVVEAIIIDNEATNIAQNIIKEPMPNGLYEPKWVDDGWVEGKAAAEFLEDEFLASLQPSPSKVLKAERELEIIELLLELEVI